MRHGLLVWNGRHRYRFGWVRRILGMPDVVDEWWVVGDGPALGPYFGPRYVAEAAALADLERATRA